MQLYRERLWPAPWILIAAALVIPASLLVFLPISEIAGVVVAIGLYAGSLALLFLASPVITVTRHEFTAGKARIPIELLGAASVHRDEDARQERGPRLDARAWLLIRGWVDPVLRIEVTDDNDPTPYWLVSSRHPEQLATAIEDARASRGAVA